MITVVTAFVPIPDHPRSEAEYHEMGNRLLALNDRFPVLFAEGDLEHCWLWKWVMQRPDGFTWSTEDNPKKNSLAYLCVQAQKTEWLVEASLIDPVADVFCWIDFGIHHLRGVTNKIIEEFLKRADNEQAIAIPGCWGRDYEYDDRYPMWRFCGGLMVVPRKYVDAFDAVMKEETKRWFKLTKNVSWEVNTLCRVEQRYPELPIWQYRADHNASMFTAYKRTEMADVQRA